MTARIIHWVLGLAALLVFMVMFVWTVPAIQSDAQDLLMFDARPFGYGFDQAKTFLSGLEQKGLELYLTTHRRLDTVFPILFALAVPWALWLVTEGWKKPYRIGVCLVAVIGPFCDLTENYLVAGMLEAGPEALTEKMVTWANGFSVAKWVLLVIAVAALLLLFWSGRLSRWKSH